MGLSANTRKKGNRGLRVALLSFLLLFGLFAISSELTPSNSSATDHSATATVNLSIPDNISIDLSKTELNIDFEIAGGVDAFESDNTVVEVSTNAFTGYTLSMTDNDTSPANNTSLIRQKLDPSDEDSVIPTLGSGTFTSTTMTSPSWGYSVTDSTSGYKAVPALGSTNVIKTTDTSAISDLTPVYFGAKVPASLMPGTYTSTVIFTAIANYQPSVSDTITAISPNSISSAGGDELTIDTNITYDENLVDSTHPLTVTLVNVADSTNTVSCTGVTLASNSGNLRITCTVGSGLEADGSYVVKLEFSKLGGLNYTSSSTIIAEGLNLWSITYMQEMTPEVCSGMYTPSNAIGDNVTIITDEATYKSTVTADNQPYVPQNILIDVRGKDGTGTMANPATGNNEQTYIVRKLADGNCWMIQDLNMSLSASVALTNETTDIGYGEDSNGERTGRTSWTPDYNTQIGVGVAWDSEGTDGARSVHDNQDRWWNGGTSYTYSAPSDPIQASIYYFGNRYNWNAATAGSGYTKNGSTYTHKYSSNQYAADSICPKGWKLPLDVEGTTTNGSFNYLIRNKYNIPDSAGSYNDVIVNPMSFTAPGYYYFSNNSGNNLRDIATHGYFQSSTVQTDASARFLELSTIYGGSLSPQAYGFKGNGYSIRCVAR